MLSTTAPRSGIAGLTGEIVMVDMANFSRGFLDVGLVGQVVVTRLVNG